MADELQRPVIDVAAAVGGWPDPWPNVEEIASVLPADSWTLVGGLMTQLHAIHRGIGVVRPTNDIDIVLHIETSRGLPARAAAALESLGYRLQTSVDPRNNTAHRFVRDGRFVDVVTSLPNPVAPPEIVDVLIAEHAAPSVEEPLRGHDMIRIEGGTQALRRTIKARLEITPGTVTTVSVPGPYGALILKAAAYVTDSRDPDRHLFDAAALLACVEDPFAEREHFAGSDRSRLSRLESALSYDHLAWLRLPDSARAEAQAALRILCATT